MELDKINFTFNGTCPTVDATSVDYKYQVIFRAFTWEIRKRFSEFEFLVEQVCTFIYIMQYLNITAGVGEICSIALTSAQNPSVYEC